MSDPAAMSLGSKLAPLLGNGFFRPLARPTAAIYIDCADRLAEAADEGGQVAYDEARLLVRDTLSRYSSTQLDVDEGGQFNDINQRSGQFFNKLIEAGWIQDRHVSLDERWILLSPWLRMLLRLLRDLSEDRPSELRDFAATLRSICGSLQSPEALNPQRLGAEEMRQTVKDLLDRASRADDQMHAVETLILRHENTQRASGSAQETLQNFLVDFHTGQHMVCYDALQGAALLPRINQARATVQEALNDPFTKQRLAEGLAVHWEINATEAYVEAERMLARLERHLSGIPKKQRLIDGRMADFSRLSAARYRYQMEIRGRRPEQVKAYIADAARQHKGTSFSALANEPGMPLLSPEVEVYFGVDSLSRQRKARPAINLTLENPGRENDPEAAKEEIRRRNLNLLTPQRAAKFVEHYLAAKGDSITTEQMHIYREDELLDLLAVLAFDRGPAGEAQRSIRWRVSAMRTDLGTEPDRIPADKQADRMIERFTIQRLS